MKLEHPIYGQMTVPDKADDIRLELQIIIGIQEEVHNKSLQAYRDMLELALDLERRKQDEDAL